MENATYDWQNRAKRVIAALCAESYRQANTTKSGARRKRHVPYTVPETAERLIAALNVGDEHTAKAIMLYDYYARKAL